MIETLKQFTSGTKLFYAVSALLAKLNIEFDRETAEPINVADLCEQSMPQYFKDALNNIENTYFVGIANNDSLQGLKNAESLDSVAETMQNKGKYDGMFIFACDAKSNTNLTRSTISALTRAFNRIASANPVILFVRQGKFLSLSTCERTTYSQEWRQWSGEKLGRVNILRDINCEHTHRGHLDILETLAKKRCNTFDDLYSHWLDTFSSELLTKRFYGELSDWYAWAVQIVKFPNDLSTDTDDTKFNQEACIRLITRLIFVWFLKQKHLIPEEFFDEDYIRENLIENFNPHDRDDLFYRPSDSKYYRLILQNLFFAMLNCPIVAEGKTSPTNRRFMRESFQGKNPDYNINNIMRYKKEFMEGGADKLVKLANSKVPFLNGGLFECLDNKDTHKFYDGFSEEKKSLEQISLPDYLFFGEEIGNGIDLSQWYGDKKKKNVSARGLIDIFKHYCFTIEENTPFDQEVSLDPELLGKAFENLLAAYNPETMQSARKQTGSYYTRREIVQYMVDESLVAHLKRMCGDDLEPQYRQLLSYATDDIELTDDQRKSIMNAIYNCRVLDPACGSGAFPMGMLQQMVHVLKRIDPTNKMWESMMVDIAIAEAKKELLKVTAGNDAEKAKIEENRKARLYDIKSAFNQSINDPDYARKLYLIEHCIYGVDIQPIATQISKLRFFISLVVDQKPTKSAEFNFGIRPLPNLEAKFVTANTLIPLDRSRDLFSSSEEIRLYEERLQDINHRIFNAKKSSVKKQLQDDMYATRATMAQVMENNNFIGSKGHNQLMSWDMFNQNSSANFFDPEWMFGVKEGFDVVIGNPPWIESAALNVNEKLIYQRIYRKVAVSQYDIFCLFISKALSVLNNRGFMCFITPNRFLTNKSYIATRKFLIDNSVIKELDDLGDGVFDNVSMPSAITITSKDLKNDYDVKCRVGLTNDFSFKHINVFKTAPDNIFSVFGSSQEDSIIEKMKDLSEPLSCHLINSRGVECGKKAGVVRSSSSENCRRFLRGEDMGRYYINEGVFIKLGEPSVNYKPDSLYHGKKILIRKTGIGINAVIDYEYRYFLQCIYCFKLKVTSDLSLEYILGCLNSRLFAFYYFNVYGEKDRTTFPHLVQSKVLDLPICTEKKHYHNEISSLVKEVLKINNPKEILPLETEIDHIVYHLYDLTYDEVLIIDPDTPITREEYDNFKLD